MTYIKGKGYVEVSGRKVCSKRKMDLNLARVFGYENNTEGFTRLLIESRASREALTSSWMIGKAIKEKEANRPNQGE